MWGREEVVCVTSILLNPARHNLHPVLFIIKMESKSVEVGMVDVAHQTFMQETRVYKHFSIVYLP